LYLNLRSKFFAANLETPTTCNYFKELTDGLNHVESLIPDYEANLMELTITGIYFAHNLIVIEKGRNDHPSNLVSNGELLNH